MCPFCLATTATIVAGTIAGSGGVAALVGTLLLKKFPMKVSTQSDEKEVLHGGSRTSSQAA